MTKSDIYSLLDSKNIQYEKYDHIAVYTIEEMLQQNLPHTDAIAKNLFLRDDKNRDFYLVTARENSKVNMKDLQSKISSRRLTFAKSEQLSDILQLYAGRVTPLGLLCDSQNRVHFILDSAYKDNDLIGIHPLDNTATIYLKVCDLLSIIKNECADITTVDFLND